MCAKYFSRISSRFGTINQSSSVPNVIGALWIIRRANGANLPSPLQVQVKKQYEEVEPGELFAWSSVGLTAWKTEGVIAAIGGCNTNWNRQLRFDDNVDVLVYWWKQRETKSIYAGLAPTRLHGNKEMFYKRFAQKKYELFLKGYL